MECIFKATAGILVDTILISWYNVTEYHNGKQGE